MNAAVATSDDQLARTRTCRVVNALLEIAGRIALDNRVCDSLRIEKSLYRAQFAAGAAAARRRVDK